MPWIMGFLSAVVVWFLFFRNGDASVGDLIGIAVLTVLCTYAWVVIDKVIEFMDPSTKTK